MSMQMYLEALMPEAEKLSIRDIPKNAVSFNWKGQEITISRFHTGKGLRSLLVCPNCNHRCYELIRYYPKHDDPICCCKKCSPYEKNPYMARTNLDDGSITALIDYHINKQIDALEKLGVRIETRSDDRQQIEAKMDQHSPPSFFTPVLMDYRELLWQRPKSMKSLTFKRMLVKLQLLYCVKNDAIRRQVCYSGSSIKKFVSKEAIDEVIQRYDAE